MLRIIYTKPSVLRQLPEAFVLIVRLLFHNNSSKQKGVISMQAYLVCYYRVGTNVFQVKLPYNEVEDKLLDISPSVLSAVVGAIAKSILEEMLIFALDDYATKPELEEIAIVVEKDGRRVFEKTLWLRDPVQTLKQIIQELD
jgi:hypothetical protein